MNHSEFSYLDFTVMPFLRRKVISSDACILFNQTVSKVLWANAVGTDLFGGNGIYSLLNLELSDKHSLVRQIKNAAKQIEDRHPVERGFRVARGFKSDLMQGELSKIKLPNGEESLLLVFEAHGKVAKMREHELAVMAVDALDDFADAAAIVDEYGLVLASSSGFDTLDIDADTLENLISVVAREDDRLVKRKIELGTGLHAGAGLGRIRDMPGRFLIVIADASDPMQNDISIEGGGSSVSAHELTAILLDENSEVESDSVEDEQLPPWLDETIVRDDNASALSDRDVLSLDGDDALPALASEKADIELIPISVSSDEDETIARKAEAEDDLPNIEEEASEEKTSEHKAENNKENAGSNLETKEANSLLDRWYFSDNTEKTGKAKTDESTDLVPFADLEELNADAERREIADHAINPDDDHQQSIPSIQNLDLEDAKSVELAADEPIEAETYSVGEGESIDDEADFGDGSKSSENDALHIKAASTQQPRRFAFSIDRNQTIKSVSPELAASVGELSGAILEKHWKEISQQRRFDENGAILRILEKADTWSGKTVLWPVDETDMVVPVDLAALPVFDRERNFDGFRGFGVIRMDDAIVDPSGMGLKISQPHSFEGVETRETAEQTEDALEQDSGTPQQVWGSNLDAEDADANLEPAREPVQKPINVSENENWHRPNADNVFQLPGRKPVGKQISENQPVNLIDDNLAAEEMPGDEKLSGKEQRAFSEISRSLTEQTKDTEVEKTLVEQTETSDLAALQHNSPLASQSLLETLPVPLFVYRSDKTLFANEALLQLTGYASTQEIADLGGIDVLLSDRDVLKTADPRGMKLIAKDGRKIDVRSRLTSVSWQNERALCLTFAEIINSPADEKAALDIVRVSELENILETAADGILVIDQDGKIESLNASGEALFGLEQKNVVGKSFGKLFATESRQALEAYIRDYDRSGVSSVMNQGQQVIGLEAGGGLIPLFATIGRVGNSNRYCAVLRDLTQWKKNEEELVEAKRNAETASEQKSEFLSRISHEIREPLTAIIGFSDVMIEERFGKIDNERYREYLKDINRSGIHVLDLVNDLLDISKIEAGKLELSYEAVDLNQLAAETVALLQPQANNKRILIRTSLSRAVPKVVADARSVRQIILNLVSNAINHSPTNSQVIVSTTFEENSEVGLRIRDTGDGMSPEEIQRALQPFTQVGSGKKTGHPGSGLGLPLTKALIEANRAYFELESTPGEGTIAHIQFPSQRVLAD